MKITSKVLKLFNKDNNQQAAADVSMDAPQKAVDTPEKHNEKETKKSENTSNIKENKMDKGKARIYNLIIVDESGSMAPLREATLSGINETINTIRSAQEEFSATQEHTLTLVTFDSNLNRPNVRTMIDNQPIVDVAEFKDYAPYGCTPLYDAMGQSLTTLYERIKDDEDASAVVTVLTDGLENDSHEWNANSLRELIEKLKEEGWSFSYMGSAHNVKEVTDLLSIENVVEFSHDITGANNTWNRERSSRQAYYRKIDRAYAEGGMMTQADKMNLKRQYAKEYYSRRITPNHITQLQEGEIFVFGSNVHGHHAGGAAAFAVKQFGAIWGQGEGLQGQCYAIPTMEGLDSMKAAIDRFAAYADLHQEMRFLVTRIGCGIAGYSVREIAPLFKGCIALENVTLPADFWKELGLNMDF